MLFSYAVAKFLAYWAWSAYGVAQSTPDSSPSARAIRGAPFEGDYFDDTDLWFSAGYNPTDKWRLSVTSAFVGDIQPTSSGARLIMSGVSQLVVIPAVELRGSSNITGRHTAFTHEGDFGQQGGPWSGDPTPEVGAAQMEISLMLADL